jgi:hypothetical protein
MLPKSTTDDTRHARCTVKDDGGLLQVSEHMEVRTRKHDPFHTPLIPL